MRIQTGFINAVSILLLVVSVKPDRPEANEDDCFPPNDLDYPPDASAIGDGATELYKLINGKQTDEDSFKKVALGWLSVAKIGLQIVNEDPDQIGSAAGAVLGLIDRLAPVDISDELKCMRVHLERLTQIMNKLGDIHKDIKHIVELLKAQDPSVTYLLYRKDLNDGHSALMTYARNHEKYAQAEHACLEKSPMAVRLNVKKLIDEQQFGMGFLAALRVKANCDDELYTKLVSVVMMDMLKLTLLEEVCNKVLNASKKSSSINLMTAAEEIKDASLALLAGRYEMQKACLRADAELNFTAYANLSCSNESATNLADQLTSRYPLIRPSAVGLCENGELNETVSQKTFGSLYVDSECCSYLEQGCEQADLTFFVQDRWSVLTVLLPANNTEAAVRLFKRQGEDACHRKNDVCSPCDHIPEQEEMKPAMMFTYGR